MSPECSRGHLDMMWWNLISSDFHDLWCMFAILVFSGEENASHPFSSAGWVPLVFWVIVTNIVWCLDDFLCSQVRRVLRTLLSTDECPKSNPNEAFSIPSIFIFDVDPIWCETHSSRGQVSEIGRPSSSNARYSLSPSFLWSNHIPMTHSRFC